MAFSSALGALNGVGGMPAAVTGRAHPKLRILPASGGFLLAAEGDDGGSIRDLLQALPGNVTQSSDLMQAFFECQIAITRSDIFSVGLFGSN